MPGHFVTGPYTLRLEVLMSWKLRSRWLLALAVSSVIGTSALQAALPTAEELLKQPFSPIEKGPETPAPAAAGRGGGAGFIESMGALTVRSPEVLPDYKIKFSFAAPNAKRVQLQGDF